MASVLPLTTTLGFSHRCTQIAFTRIQHSSMARPQFENRHRQSYSSAWLKYQYRYPKH